MSAINLGLNGLYGWAVWMNTLTLECHCVYKIGIHFRGATPGVIQEVPVEASPFHYVKPTEPKRSNKLAIDDQEPKPETKGQQLDLF
jgi:hypothetical protein